ncbi:MAG TPA: hypothetical protein VGO46_05460 [Gemmatimonadaceae bacterium]|jgi:hypothetical protein|nr:hypothetical protein [Gemmatimonadaceae bacterium]
MADAPKPLDGTTTVDAQVVFEAQRLSYDAVRIIAEKIARRISGRTRNKEVVIAGTQLLADFSNLVSIKSVLEELVNAYASLADLARGSAKAPTHRAPAAAGVVGTGSRFTVIAAVGAAISGLATVTAGVQGALTLIELFRQDVDYKGVPIAIDTLAFQLELASRIRMHKATAVVVPEFTVFSAPSRAEGALCTLIRRVHRARSDALLEIAPGFLGGRRLTPYVIADIRPVDHLSGESERTSDKPSDEMHDSLAEIDKRFSDLQAQLEKSDVDATGLTLLARLLRVESILMRSPVLVHARVVLAGGNNRVQRNLFRTLFWSDGLSSTGGAVVSWAILSPDGAVEDGGIFTESRSAKSPEPPEHQSSIA